MSLFVVCLPTIEEDSTKPDPYTYDSFYIRKPSAILKIAQIVCTLVAFLYTIVAPSWSGVAYRGYEFFCTICQFYMWGVILFFLGTAFNVKPYYYRWSLWEFVYCLFATISLAMGSIVAAALSVNTSLTAAAMFGFFSVVLFGIGGFNNYRDWKAISSRGRELNNI